MTTLELLAPAKNLECGIAAIDHGADAVYIGASQFGARAGATNVTDDIAQLCRYAHRFRAKVYVTVNTIVYEQELNDVEQLLTDLCSCGVDAVLVQDMALVGIIRKVSRKLGRRMDIHASTQTDNRTPERVAWLGQSGFSRVVLARELSLDDMAAIHRHVPDVELEAFVHGALCVSFSGVCYASQHCFSRSANRGECAQFCRLKFSLVDADGKEVDRPRHWLSLRDMCRIRHLEKMAECGVTSFKIEGRLKDIGYVKNVVAAYSQELDRIVAASGGKYRRSSLGKVSIHFKPDLRKTFNRGFTTYFLEGDSDDIASPDTPKALGEYMGKVKEIRRDSFNVAGLAAFANGDGLCFFDRQGELKGFRVNRAEGNRIFPQHMPQELRPGLALYRNADAAMDKLLAKQSAERKIPIDLALDRSAGGLILKAAVLGTDIHVQTTNPADVQPARQSQEENIRRQLSKWGNTVYELKDLTMDDRIAQCFIPSSQLTAMRRDLAEQLDEALAKQEPTPELEPGVVPAVSEVFPKIYRQYDYLYNVANSQAKAFYVQHGLNEVGKAFDLGNKRGKDRQDAPLLMQCRHCLRRLLGGCTKHGGKRPAWREPLFLVLPDGRRFPLRFDCQQCQMLVYAE